MCNMELNNLYCSANIVLARLKELRHLGKGKEFPLQARCGPEGR